MDCVEGYNCTIFAYGQTGAGKTYTMMGVNSDHDKYLVQRGLIPRTLECLFQSINQQREQGVHYLIRCSFLEIYNEQIIDLLNKTNNNLQIREDTIRGVYVEGINEKQIQHSSQALEVLERGSKSRHVGSTCYNEASSRSHSVFTLLIESRETHSGVLNTKNRQFHFIDLAGSQRTKQIYGQRLKEGCSINKALLNLGTVINALSQCCEGRPKYVNYRDSKLTFLLKDALGGNSKTHLIANISPSTAFYQQTLSTLGFARRVKLIKRTKASINEDASGNLDSLKNEIKRLKQEIINLRSQPHAEQPATTQLLKEYVCEQIDKQTKLQVQILRQRQQNNLMQRAISEYSTNDTHLRMIVQVYQQKVNRLTAVQQKLIQKANALEINNALDCDVMEYFRKEREGLLYEADRNRSNAQMGSFLKQVLSAKREDEDFESVTMALRRNREFMETVQERLLELCPEAKTEKESEQRLGQLERDYNRKEIEYQEVIEQMSFELTELRNANNDNDILLREAVSLQIDAEEKASMSRDKYQQQTQQMGNQIMQLKKIIQQKQGQFRMSLEQNQKLRQVIVSEEEKIGKKQQQLANMSREKRKIEEENNKFKQIIQLEEQKYRIKQKQMKDMRDEMNKIKIINQEKYRIKQKEMQDMQDEINKIKIINQEIVKNSDMEKAKNKKIEQEYLKNMQQMDSKYQLQKQKNKNEYLKHVSQINKNFEIKNQEYLTSLELIKLQLQQKEQINRESIKQKESFNKKQEQLKLNNQNYVNQIKQITIQLQTLEKQFASKENQLCELNKKLNQVKVVQQTMVNKNLSLQQQIQIFKQKQQQMLIKNQKLFEEIKMIQAKLIKQKQTTQFQKLLHQKQMKQLLERTQVQKNELKKDIFDRESFQKQLKSANAELRNSIGKLYLQITNLTLKGSEKQTQWVQKYRKDINQKEQELQKTLKEFSETKKKMLSLQKEVSEQQHKLYSQNEQNKVIIKRLQIDLKHKQNQLMEYEKKQIETKKIIQNISSSTKKNNQTYEKQCLKLNQQIKRLKIMNEKNIIQISNAKLLLDQNEQKHKKYIKEAMQQKQIHEDKQIQSLQKIQQLNKKLIEIQTNNQHNLISLKNMQEKLEQKDLQLVKNKQKFIQLQQQILNAQNDKKVIQLKICQINQCLKNNNQSITLSSQKNIDLQNSLSKQIQKSLSISILNNKLKEKVQQLDQKIHSLQEKQKNKIKNITEISKQYEENRQQLQKINQKLLKQQKQLQQNIKEQKQIEIENSLLIDNLKKQIQDYSFVEKEWKRNHEKFKEEKSQFQKQIQQLKIGAERLRREWTLRVQKLNNENVKMQDAQMKLKLLLENKENQLSELKEQLEEKDEIYRKLLDKVARFEQEHKKMPNTQDYMKTVQLLEKSRAGQIQLRRQLEEQKNINMAINNGNDENEKMQRQNEEIKKKNCQMKKQIENLKEQNCRLHEELQTTQSHVEEVNSKSESYCILMQKRLEEIQKDYFQLQRNHEKTIKQKRSYEKNIHEEDSLKNQLKFTQSALARSNSRVEELQNKIKYQNIQFIQLQKQNQKKLDLFSPSNQLDEKTISYINKLKAEITTLKVQRNTLNQNLTRQKEQRNRNQKIDKNDSGVKTEIQKLKSQKKYLHQMFIQLATVLRIPIHQQKFKLQKLREIMLGAIRGKSNEIILLKQSNKQLQKEVQQLRVIEEKDHSKFQQKTKQKWHRASSISQKISNQADNVLKDAVKNRVVYSNIIKSKFQEDSYEKKNLSRNREDFKLK